MRALRELFPRVAARRVWRSDGVPVWEFRFTSRPGPSVISGVEDVGEPSEPRATPVRFVSSRGVEIGGDTLRVDQFHHRIRKPAAAAAGAIDAAGDHPEWLDVAGALVDLAADPGSAVLQQRVVVRLARVHPWFRGVAVIDISAARIAGGGLGQALDGVFVWRADGGPNRTYLVAPDQRARDVLVADPDLLQALISVACPAPDAALGELEGRLREALTRLGVAAPTRTGGGRPGVPAGLVLAVDTELSADHVSTTGGRPKSASERALSEELAELARRVGAASVRGGERPSKAG